jgi:glycosyltransferase involved in cell wall biosynthesis
MSKGRLIISAFGISPPGTMGGNSKIALELARYVSKYTEVHIFLQDYKIKTITENIPKSASLHIHAVSDYPQDFIFRPISSTLHFYRFMRRELSLIGMTKEDFVYACSDWHADILPLMLLRKKLHFTWVASFFLFVPGFFENIYKQYGFPKFKYILYRMYQRFLFSILCRNADCFIITNESDKQEFPERLRKKVFPFYGGVNVNQIPDDAVKKTRDAVYCSRLHPQKGLLKFLDAWRLVLQKCPDARLSVIGNGDMKYETELHSRAEELGIDGTIEWLGYVNNREKYEIYRSSKVLVHTTVFDNNGMVAAEALCSGLPVVMFDLPALRDVYTVGCIKISFGDYKAFADAVVDRIVSPIALETKEIEELRSKWD